MNARKGILAGGNWIIDFIKLIDTYPEENALATILEEKTGNGGAPFNVLKALQKMEVSFPLEGIGLVGDDPIGKEILFECERLQIDSRQIKVRHGCVTSFTDVMTVSDSGKRTFFHHRGASAYLGAEDFDFSQTNCRIFHLGYLLLLDKLDEMDKEGRSGASRVLEAAVKAGLTTSADIVSEQSDRYRSIIPSSLPFIDILFLNEREAEGLTGIKILKKDGLPQLGEIVTAGRQILTMGVRSWVIFHFPAGAVSVGKDGSLVQQSAVKLPRRQVKGTVGAGDAFAAGVLAEIHEGGSMSEALLSGVCVAATSLLSSCASGGIRTWPECLVFGSEYGFLSV